MSRDVARFGSLNCRTQAEVRSERRADTPTPFRRRLWHSCSSAVRSIPGRKSPQPLSRTRRPRPRGDAEVAACRTTLLLFGRGRVAVRCAPREESHPRDSSRAAQTAWRQALSTGAGANNHTFPPAPGALYQAPQKEQSRAGPERAKRMPLLTGPARNVRSRTVARRCSTVNLARRDAPFTERQPVTVKTRRKRMFFSNLSASGVRGMRFA
jgi:hypothetical protein